MIDPNMFERGTYYKGWMANYYPEVDISQAKDYCDETIDGYLNSAGFYCREYSDSIKNVICVVTKLDMLLEAEAASFGSGDIEIITDVGQKHRDAVNERILGRVRNNLNTFFNNRFHIDLLDKLMQTFGDDKNMALLGVSTSTLQKATDGKRFNFKADASMVSSKHRIIEPFLVILMYFGLVNVRKPDGSLVRYNGAKTQIVKEAPKQEPKKKGFFAKLFGK